MSQAHVLSNEDLAHRRRVWFAVGLLAGLGFAGAVVIGTEYLRQPRGFTGVPEIVRQTDTETVARIRTRQGERELDCTLTIDHKRRAWSLSC